MSIVKWTNAHRRKVAEAMLQLAQADVLKGRWNAAVVYMRNARRCRRVTRTDAYDMFMTHYLAWDAPNARKRACAAMRHVDRLARGERVQEVGWRAVRHFGELGQFHEDRDSAQGEADEEDVDDTGRGRIVRVRRTRKAT